jgi:ferrochelatase
MTVGILLVNLGTPQTPEAASVYRYLIEFLTDSRVIDLPWLQKQLLVRGLIVPRRYKASAAAYRCIWQEEGSPLLIYGRRVEEKLQAALGDDYKVVLAMRYQTPSLEEGLAQLAASSLRQLIIIPLFPQYASATTGSVHEAVMRQLQKWQVIPEVTFVNSYATHPKLIEAFVERIQSYDLASYDHLLFSFHGLPERQIRKIDQHGHCLQTGCCQVLSCHNANCYRAQCYATARAIVNRLALTQEQYTVCFQSRLGSEPWLQPYTSEVLPRLCREGRKRLLVVCPAFVADCLETIYEISVEYAAEFKREGGESLDLVPGLNESAAFIDTLKTLVQARTLAFDTAQAIR